MENNKSAMAELINEYGFGFDTFEDKQEETVSEEILNEPVVEEIIEPINKTKQLIIFKMNIFLGVVLIKYFKLDSNKWRFNLWSIKERFK